MNLSLIANFLAITCLTLVSLVHSNELEPGKEWFKIEGKVQAPDAWAKLNPDWKLYTSVLIDGGQYKAFLRYFAYLY